MTNSLEYIFSHFSEHLQNNRTRTRSAIFLVARPLNLLSWPKANVSINLGESLESDEVCCVLCTNIDTNDMLCAPSGSVINSSASHFCCPHKHLPVQLYIICWHYCVHPFVCHSVYYVRRHFLSRFCETCRSSKEWLRLLFSGCEALRETFRSEKSRIQSSHGLNLGSLAVRLNFS